MRDDDSRRTPYTGPHIVILEGELAPLAELLQLNPRPWNSSLRSRIDHARKLRGKEAPPEGAGEPLSAA